MMSVLCNMYTNMTKEVVVVVVVVPISGTINMEISLR